MFTADLPHDVMEDVVDGLVDDLGDQQHALLLVSLGLLGPLPPGGGVSCDVIRGPVVPHDQQVVTRCKRVQLYFE